MTPTTTRKTSSLGVLRSLNTSTICLGRAQSAYSLKPTAEKPTARAATSSTAAAGKANTTMTPAERVSALRHNQKHLNLPRLDVLTRLRAGPWAAAPMVWSATRRDGGIGRRGGLKNRSPQGRGGSNPPLGTTVSNSDRSEFSMER